MSARRRLGLLVSMPALLAACGSHSASLATTNSDIDTASYDPVNLAAGSMVLYEVQARTANACLPTLGSPDQQAACSSKPSPVVTYRQQGQTCDSLSTLGQIKLGTLDDMLENTADYREGITVRYVNERVGANTLWMMPMFPDNMQYSVPDACDNLGSPYAVTDYFHMQGSLSRACIAQGADEYSATPCWANAEFDQLIAQAHSRGMKVMMDVAFNHFGHNYNMYDYGNYTPVRERTAQNQDLTQLWNFDATYEDDLVHPTILDTPATLTTLAQGDQLHATNLAALNKQCPGLQGDALVRGYNMWREAFDYERANFNCTTLTLESNDPGFYLSADALNPSRHVGDDFSVDWPDVKFLFHHEDNVAHQYEFVREREYLFRVMNYWTSRGVDAFRLDHTTDPNSGLGANEWQYLTTKNDYYAAKRGQSQPVYLAEEFIDPASMNKVVDVLTEGYVNAITDRTVAVKDTNWVDNILTGMDRFGDHAFIMTGMETHDEPRLIDSTGFDIWTGAGVWGIGAATRSTPMIFAGQEFGEPYGLAFKRSDYLDSRFTTSDQYNAQGDTLIGYYQTLIKGRLDNANRALIAQNYKYLLTKDGSAVDSRIFAMAKWSDDGNVVFVMHNLWEQDVSQHYAIPSDVAASMNISDTIQYQLFDAIAGQTVGACQSGAALKADLYVTLPSGIRAQWLRLVECN